MKQLSETQHKIVIGVILLVALIFAAYLYFSGLQGSPQKFQGPTSAPHVVGPKTLPPS